MWLQRFVRYCVQLWCVFPLYIYTILDFQVSLAFIWLKLKFKDIVRIHQLSVCVDLDDGFKNRLPGINSICFTTNMKRVAHIYKYLSLSFTSIKMKCAINVTWKYLTWRYNYVFGPHITSRAGRDFYRAIPVVTCTLGFCRRRLLRQAADAASSGWATVRSPLIYLPPLDGGGSCILVVVCVNVDTEMIDWLIE